MYQPKWQIISAQIISVQRAIEHIDQQLTKIIQNPVPTLPVPTPPVGTGADLDLWRLILLYLLVGGSIGVVTSLIFYFGSAPNPPVLVTAGISAIVGLVSFLAGHTAASVGKEKSEQRIIDASGNKKNP